MSRETLNNRIETKLDSIADNIDRKISVLYEKVNETCIKVAKIETHLSDMNGSMKGQKTKVEKLDKRLRWTENKVHVAIGGVGVIAIIITKLAGLW